MKQSKTFSCGFLVIDIVERLRDNYTWLTRAGFDTSARSVADAANEIESLRQQLAASQAREQHLLALLKWYRSETPIGHQPSMICHIVDDALAMPKDTAALEALIAKSGEVMQERCATECEKFEYPASREAAAIRALPKMTLEDLN